MVTLRGGRGGAETGRGGEGATRDPGTLDTATRKNGNTWRNLPSIRVAVLKELDQQCGNRYDE